MFKEITSAIEAGTFRYNLFFGQDEKSKKLILRDQLSMPGAVLTGAMGSGKTVALSASVRLHKYVNNEDTFVFFVDPLKTGLEYSWLREDENVIKIFDTEGFANLTKFLMVELEKRKSILKEANVSSVRAYNESAKSKLATIIIACEDFHYVPHSDEFKYSYKADSVGTPAWNLKTLMRVGRSYGIYFLLSTSRSTPDDIPSSLKPGLTTALAFRVNNPGDAAALNLPGSADIRAEERGRCAYDDGFSRFPLLTEDQFRTIRIKYENPYSAIMASGLKLEEIRNFVLKGINPVKEENKVTEITKSAFFSTDGTNLNTELTYHNLDNLLGSIGYQTHKTPSPALELSFIIEKKGIKTAVFVIHKLGNPDLVFKRLDRFYFSANLLKISNKVIINLDDVRLRKDDSNNTIIGKEDLRHLILTLSDRLFLEKNGYFESLMNLFPLLEKKRNAKD
jgi:hypothetical protein